MEVRITLSEKLLDEVQKEILNPLSVTITCADSMPDKPIPYSQLRKEYELA
jgi:hypothetical protein